MVQRRGQSSGSPSGRLRIVAGKWRSRLLRIAAVPGLRPTAERIRETLFNWLAPRIGGARCLDLYAGTGALGFEALSRDAAEVVFVEKSSLAVAALETARRELDAAGARIEQRDAFDFLTSADDGGFDIVFLDPPFADESLGELCRLLEKHGWLEEGAVVYFEQDRKHALPDLPESWSIRHDKTAGQVRYGLIAT